MRRMSDKLLQEMTNKRFVNMGYFKSAKQSNLATLEYWRCLLKNDTDGYAEIREDVAQLITLNFEIEKTETRIEECLIIAGSEDGKILGLCGRLVAGDKSRILAQIKAHEQYLARLKAKREELWKQ